MCDKFLNTITFHSINEHATYTTKFTRTGYVVTGLLGDVAPNTVVAVRVWCRVVAQSVSDLCASITGLATGFPAVPLTPAAIN